VPEDTRFCPDCGEPIVRASEVTETTAQQTTASQTTVPQNPWDVAPKKKSALALPKKAIGILGGVVVAIVLLIIIFSGGKGAGSPKKAATNYVKAVLSGNLNKVQKYSAFDLVEQYSQDYDVSTKEAKAQLSTSIKAISALIKNVSVKVKSSEKLTGDDFDDALDDIEWSLWYYDEPDKILDISKITEIYAVKIEMTATFYGEKDTDTETFTVVKIGGKWFVADDTLV
jgi:hypothetical protein